MIRPASGQMTIISIHAPREGSDMVCRQRRRAGQHFYPRSPRGERPWMVGYLLFI